MCLAMPAQIVSIEEDNATVSLGGVKKSINLSLVDDVAVGDYVIIHVGYALSKLDQQEAEKTLKDFQSMYSEKENRY